MTEERDMTQGKTLAELDVKPGDVVEWDSSRHTVQSAEILTEGRFKGQVQANLSEYGDGIFGDEKFRIISRASDTPRPFGELTDEEKGALLLAHHEGRTGS